MYANALLGVWPFIFEHNPRLRKLYNVFSTFTFTYFFLFIITSIMKLCELITAKRQNVQEIYANVSITLLYTVTILRVYALKTKRLKNIIKEIIETETKIRASEDKPIITLYDSHTKQSQFSNLIFLLNIFVGKYKILHWFLCCSCVCSSNIRRKNGIWDV